MTGVNRRVSSYQTFCLLVFCVATAGAGDVTLRTDHPSYPGEGAFQTIEDCVRFATVGKEQPQDKAIAMYKWLLTHQWHLMSPMEWCVPGRTPDSADPGDYETVLFDANRGRFSYGYGLCGTVHAWNELYWKALGMPARRREFPNHINSEIFYDNAWHAFDTDMAGLVFRSDGTVAGYDDIVNNPELAKSTNAPIPHYPFAWPEDFNTMKAGWKEVARKKKWYSLYNGSHASHPGIVNLRGGETFTRYYDRDHFGGSTKRRFWQHQPGGPERRWTYFNNGDPVHDKADSNARSLATYCNGEFVYEPRLSSQKIVDELAAFSGNPAFRKNAPAAYAGDDKQCSLSFRHLSPYVICGDPVDDANPMSGKATDGFVIEGQFHGNVICEVSVDEGQTWQKVNFSIDEESGPRQSDATELVKGRYGWLARFKWSGKAGINSLKFTTTTQVAQAMYPRLTEDGCSVDYRSTPRGSVAMIPNFGLPEAEVSKFEEVSLRSENLRYEPRSPKQRLAYHATDRQPAHVVFKLASPLRLTEIRAAVRYQVPVPPTKGCDFRMEVSTDAGVTWKEFANAEIPADNEFSSGWLAGTADVSESTSKKALVRFHMHTPGRPAALIDARIYGIHEAKPLGPVTVEFGWLEDGTLRTHETNIGANAVATKMRVPTKRNITDSFVRIRVTD